MSLEKLVGFLSYKDKFNRYHVLNLSHYNKEKWDPSIKDHHNMKNIEERYTDKIYERLLNLDIDDLDDSNFQTVNPFEPNGFYFVVDKKCNKVADFMGCVISIDCKMQLYTSEKFRKVGCKINALHIKKL